MANPSGGDNPKPSNLLLAALAALFFLFVIACYLLQYGDKIRRILE